jgi:hypothetical protein
MRVEVLLALWLGVPAGLAAQSPEQASPRVWKVGSEIDVLPYVLKGYYGSAFAGMQAWRLRVVASRSTIPSFLVASGYTEKRSDAYALLGDLFYGAGRQKQTGMWVGGGGEYWRSRIRTTATPAFAYYDNFMLTAGGGYVWRFSRHFYLNPWSGGHFTVGGARNIKVSGETYTQPIFTPELSVKLGISF